MHRAEENPILITDVDGTLNPIGHVWGLTAPLGLMRVRGLQGPLDELRARHNLVTVFASGTGAARLEKQTQHLRRTGINHLIAEEGALIRRAGEEAFKRADFEKPDTPLPEIWTLLQSARRESSFLGFHPRLLGEDKGRQETFAFQLHAPFYGLQAPRTIAHYFGEDLHGVLSKQLEGSGWNCSVSPVSIVVKPEGVNKRSALGQILETRGEMRIFDDAFAHPAASGRAYLGLEAALYNVGPPAADLTNVITPHPHEGKPILGPKGVRHVLLEWLQEL